MFIEYFQYFQYLSLVASIFCFRGLRYYSISLFVLLLAVVCITETTANYMSNVLNRDDNYKVYNPYLLISTPIVFYLYYKMLKLEKFAASAFLLVSVLCEGVVVLNYLFLQGTESFNSYSVIVIMFMNIIFSSFILFNLVKDEEKDTPLFQEPYFWINSANLLFSISTLVVLGLREYILEHHIVIGDKSIYRYIVPVSNVILYSAYTYAFYLCRKQTMKL